MKSATRGNSATGVLRRKRTLLGASSAAVLALGAAVVATGASSAFTPTRATTVVTQPAVSDCSAIMALVSAASTATSAGATTAGVATVRDQALRLAKSTGSNDARELLQNLADDLAAYRATLVTPSAERRSDIGVALRDDLGALRRLCGR